MDKVLANVPDVTKRLNHFGAPVLRSQTVVEDPAVLRRLTEIVSHNVGRFLDEPSRRANRRWEAFGVLDDAWRQVVVTRDRGLNIDCSLSTVDAVKQELTDDHCDACGFDSSEHSRDDLIALLAGAETLIDVALGRTSESDLNLRPDAETWSNLEYVDHIGEVFPHSRLVCEQATLEPDQPYGGDFPPGFDDPAAVLDRKVVVDALAEEARRNAELFEATSGNGWETAALVTDMRWTLRFALVHICHELLHHRDDIAAAR